MSGEVPVSSSFRKQILFLLGFANTLLILGIYHGFMQVMYRTGVLQSDSFLKLNYYDGLTLHGVVNAVVFTTLVIVAFGQTLVTYYLRREPSSHAGWLSIALMTGGTLLAAIPILMGKAQVLYTFYAPLRAHPLFYIGAALLIVGSWIPFFSWLPLVRQWRKEHPEEKLPLPIIGILATFIIWLVATIAVAVEVLVFLIPWSLGWTPQVNVPATRMLFWFFGHPLVYFWLLPAYVMYYSFLPRLVNGKLFSEDAARLVFMLFVVFSVPVGVHHQFTEPGISQSTKLIHSVFTMLVAIPSLITAFTVAASLETTRLDLPADRQRRPFSWVRNLPWTDSSRYMVPYLLVGLLLFIIGGFTGVVNASYNLNLMVHNTSWIPGHFHLTVGGPVILALFAISLYLVEQLRNVSIPRKMALWVPYLWGIGMLSVSIPMMIRGVLFGEPRRTNLGLSYTNPDSPFFKEEWLTGHILEITGACLLILAAFLYFYAFFSGLFRKPSPFSSTPNKVTLVFPTSEPFHAFSGKKYLDTFAPWLVILVILILIAYIPGFKEILETTYGGAPPYLPSSPVPWAGS